MTIIIETKKKDMWAYFVSVGDKGDMEDYTWSNYEYDSEGEAEMAAIKELAEQWLHMS